MRNVLPRVTLPVVPAVVVRIGLMVVATQLGVSLGQNHGDGGGRGLRVGWERRAAAAPAVNACGCYRDSTGSCFCGPKGKGKCDCPGDCEPKGCEEKRAKELEKEIQAETRHAQEAERKQRDEEDARRRKAEQNESKEPAASSGDSQESDEPASSAEGGDDKANGDGEADASGADSKKTTSKKAAKTTKHARKGKAKASE
jgi:hypothetical protein